MWSNPQEIVDLVTFTEEILNGKLDDILYDKLDNENFINKVEKVQFKDCLATTGAIEGTSKEKLYDKLGLLSLSGRRWYNKLIFFYQIVNGFLPNYLHSYFGFPSSDKYTLRSPTISKVTSVPLRAKGFRKSFFFLYCNDKCNNLNFFFTIIIFYWSCSI